MNKLRITIDYENYKIEYTIANEFNIEEENCQYKTLFGAINQNEKQLNLISFDTQKNMLLIGDFSRPIYQQLKNLDVLQKVYIIVKGAITEYRLRAKDNNGVIAIEVKGLLLDDFQDKQQLNMMLNVACGNENKLLNNEKIDSKICIEIADHKFHCGFGSSTNIEFEAINIEDILKTKISLINWEESKYFFTSSAQDELEFIALAKSSDDCHPVFEWGHNGWLIISLYKLGEIKPFFTSESFVVPGLSLVENNQLEQYSIYPVNQPPLIKDLRRIAFSLNKNKANEDKE